MERRFILPAKVQKEFCALGGEEVGTNAGAPDVEEVTCSLLREVVTPAFKLF